MENGFLAERDAAVSQSQKTAEGRHDHRTWAHPDLAELAKLIRPHLTAQIQEALERVDAQLVTRTKQSEHWYSTAQTVNVSQPSRPG